MAQCAALATVVLTACKKGDDTAALQEEWQARNTTWYGMAADSARNAIATAQRQWGDKWEKHCDWRILNSTKLQPGTNTDAMQTVCLHYIKHDTIATDVPLWNDAVHVNYRGWLLSESAYAPGSVFDQSYYGAYNVATAYPNKLTVSETVTGFATALQYLHKGEEVMLYIPYTLGYGVDGTESIRGGSTLLFRLHLIDFYHSDQTVPDWK